MIVRSDRQHAAHAHRGLQRHIEHGRRGERIGAVSGRLVMVERPLGHADVHALGLPLGGNRAMQAILQVRNHQCRRRGEFRFQESRADLRDLLGHQRAGQVPRHRIERPHALLARARHPRLELQPRGELADDQCHHEHHGERQQVLGVRHAEAEAGRHIEEVEHDDRQERGEHRRAASELDGDEDDRQQEDHHDVREVEQRLERSDGQGEDRADQRAPEVALPGEIVSLMDAGPGASADSCGHALSRRQCHLEQIQVCGEIADRLRETCLPGPPQPTGLPAEDHPRQIVFMRIAHDRRGQVAPAERGRDGAVVLGGLQHLEHELPGRIGQALQPGSLDVDAMPGHAELSRQPGRGSDQLFRPLVRADAQENGLARLPHRGRLQVAAVLQHLVVDAVRGAPQRQFAQGDEVALAKEVLDGSLGLLGQVDLALLQSQQEVVRRQVDDDDLVGFVEHAVGHGLPHADPGDARDDVVQALEVLDVHGRPDVDAGIQQLFDVLPPLGVSGPRDIGMRQLVDQHQLRLALERAVQVEFAQDAVPVPDFLQLEPGKPRNQGLRLGAPVRLDDADDDVDALLLLDPGGGQHGECLPDARRRAEEELQLSSARLDFLILDLGEQAVGIGSTVRHWNGSIHVVSNGSRPDRRIRTCGRPERSGSACSSCASRRSPPTGRRWADGRTCCCSRPHRPRTRSSRP